MTDLEPAQAARAAARRRAHTAAATIALQHTDRARRAFERLASSFEEVVTALRAAHTNKAHEALGYDSWEDYCAAEFAGIRATRIAIPDRVEIVAALRAVGMPSGDVGSALGVSPATVDRDIARGQGTGRHDTGAALPPQHRGARYTDPGAKAGQVIAGEVLSDDRKPRRITHPWPGQHFAMHHDLNAAAIERCRDRDHGNPSAYGACGPCWEQTIRADERARR